MSPKLLLDLPDDLLLSIIDSTPSVCYHFILVCRRLFGLCRGMYCWQVLFGDDYDLPSQLDHTISLMQQVLEQSDQKGHRLVSQRISKAKVMQIVDQALYENRLPEVFSKIFKQFKLDIFHEVTPGIYIDWLRHAGDMSPLMSRSSLYGAFGIDTMAMKQITMDVHPYVDGIIHDAVQSHATPESLKDFPPDPLFEPDLMKFHQTIPEMWRVLNHIMDTLHHNGLARDLDIYWALARIGFRIPIDSFLMNAEPSPEFLRKAIPYLSAKGCSPAHITAIYTIFETRSDLLSILIRIPALRQWLLEHSHRYLLYALYYSEFGAFRTFSQTLKHWPFITAQLLPGPLLQIAVRVQAPLDIIDSILDCPFEHLVNLRIAHMNIHNCGMKNYVVQRILSNLSKKWSQRSLRKHKFVLTTDSTNTAANFALHFEVFI